MPSVSPLAQVVLSFVSIMQTDGWVGLELRHLVALKAVAETGTFGRAATQLGYTQSAVSQQIATLERIVGQRLLERPGGPRPVSLTEAGALLLRHSDAIAARLQAAQADLTALEAGEAGPLRVGTYQSVSAKLLPGLLRGFHQEWPKVEIRLTESSDDFELLTLVEQGALDLCFVALPIRPGPFELMELLRDPHVVIAQADSPLGARTRAPSLRELAELPRISYQSCRITQGVEEQLRQGGREANIVFRSDDNGTVQALVAAGVGVAVVPRLTVDEHNSGIAVLELGDRVPPRLIGIAWHRDRLRTQAAEAFVEAARELCSRLERERMAA
jgi:DNA-binding transcriptional LysR family regulator